MMLCMLGTSQGNNKCSLNDVKKTLDYQKQSQDPCIIEVCSGMKFPSSIWSTLFFLQQSPHRLRPADMRSFLQPCECHGLRKDSEFQRRTELSSNPTSTTCLTFCLGHITLSSLISNVGIMISTYSPKIPYPNSRKLQMLSYLEKGSLQM